MKCVLMKEITLKHLNELNINENDYKDLEIGEVYSIKLSGFAIYNFDTGHQEPCKIEYRFTMREVGLVFNGKIIIKNQRSDYDS
jgi:hypothetical protein